MQAKGVLTRIGFGLGCFLSALAATQAVAQVNQCVVEAANGKLNPEIRRSVVITDAEVFQGDQFSLEKTLGAILKSAVKVKSDDKTPDATRDAANTQAERLALLTSLIRTFRIRDRENPDSKVTMSASARPGEAALNPIELLDSKNKNGMRPVGLFNRLDLAPANWRYCGEHRIVYAKGDPVSGLDRFFLIFEAALDNPDEQNGPEGCLRVAKFWDSLRRKPAVELAAALDKFYYDGDLGDGQPKIAPVVHHAHFGVPFGQVRGNLFVTQGNPGQNPWMLREWRTSLSTDGNAIFIADTVKSNPHPALYGLRGASETQDFADLRPEFQDNFIINHVREMIEAELAAERENKPLSDNELFARLSARFENRFNTFESVSQNAQTDDPNERAKNTDLLKRIETDLKNFKLPANRNLTAKHILARAGALSCGGCHQFSASPPQEIAPGVKWPPAAKAPIPGAPDGFAHINEKRELSDALEKHFLPERCSNLQRVVGSAPTPPIAMSQPRSQSQMAPQAARDAVARVQTSESRPAKLEALRELESQVQAVRRQDSQSQGAFIPFRRTH